MVVEHVTRPSDVVARRHAKCPPLDVLSVAGGRESRDPGVMNGTAAFLPRLLKLLERGRA